MKKITTRVAAIALPLLMMTLLFSCEKDDFGKRKKFKADFETFYRVSPTAPVPVVVNGTPFIGFAHFPGSGSGTATQMGNCQNHFNQLVYTNEPGGPPLGSVNAPVTDVLSYPVTGAPLPLIQASDFTSLAVANARYHFPATVQGKIINSVIYDNRGNAVFTSALSSQTFPISETKIGFSGKGIILGGRGKFNGTHGEFDFTGYFNVVDPNDAEYHLDGWISN